FIAANSCTGHLFTVSSPPISTLFPYTTLFRSRDRAIVAHVFDSPGVAVADPVLAVAKAPVVAAGDDRVPDPGGGAVGQLDLAAGCEGAVEDQVRAGTGVEGVHVVAGLGGQHCHRPGVAVGAPGGVSGIGHHHG